MNKGLKIAALSIPPLAILGFIWNSNRPRPNFAMGPSRFDTEYYPIADFDFDRPGRNTYVFGLHFGPNADKYRNVFTPRPGIAGLLVVRGVSDILWRVGGKALQTDGGMAWKTSGRPDYFAVAVPYAMTEAQRNAEIRIDGQWIPVILPLDSALKAPTRGPKRFAFGPWTLVANPSQVDHPAQMGFTVVLGVEPAEPRVLLTAGRSYEGRGPGGISSVGENEEVHFLDHKLTIYIDHRSTITYSGDLSEVRGKPVTVKVLSVKGVPEIAMADGRPLYTHRGGNQLKTHGYLAIDFGKFMIGQGYRKQGSAAAFAFQRSPVRVYKATAYRAVQSVPFKISLDQDWK